MPGQFVLPLISRPADDDVVVDPHRVLVDRRDLPLLTEWLSAPSGPSVSEQFELGLGFLPDGIAARVTS